MSTIFVGGPWYRSQVDARLAISLAQFSSISRSFGYPMIGCGYDDGMLNDSRNKLFAGVLASDADWFLSADSDVSFLGQTEAICRALDMMPNASVIGFPTKLASGDMNIIGFEEIYTVGAVVHVGYGLVAFNLNWYRENWPEDEIYFHDTVTRKGDVITRLGEDYNHSKRVAALGGWIGCDFRVQVKHHMARAGTKAAEGE